MTTTDAAGNAIYNTTDLTEGVIIDIDPMIQMLSPTDLPLLNGVGSDGRSVIAKGTCFEKKVEWQDDELLLPRSTLGAAVGTTTATVVQVAAGHRLRFQTGDVLLINDEMVRVTGYSSTANQLNVTRGFGGTTAATQSSGDVILNLGAHLSEGSDPPDARHTDWTNRYNITQIFGPTAVHLSETENTVRKYGLEGTTRFDYEASKRFKEMMIQVEQALVYGTRYEDTSNAIRQMGGGLPHLTVLQPLVDDAVDRDPVHGLGGGRRDPEQPREGHGRRRTPDGPRHLVQGTLVHSFPPECRCTGGPRPRPSARATVVGSPPPT